MKITIVLPLLTLIALPLAACSTAAPSGSAFSRDWAQDQRRSASDRKQRDQRLYVFGQEVRTPDWLDTDERGRPELRVGESATSTTAVSVDRGELGLRRRWGGNRNNLPAPPGFDERGNRVGPTEE